MGELTPFQTVGPYLSLGLLHGQGRMTKAGGGTPLVVVGRLADGAGEGIPDGVLEFWAAGFDGIGRALTGSDGGYRLETLVPDGGNIAGAMHAPHFAVRVLGRGILSQYLTRMYLAGHPVNDVDPVLQGVPANRRGTLLATAIGDATYSFDVVVQGPGETVFFDL